MRFGKWRGVPLTFVLAAVLGLGSTAVRADGWRLQHTIPRVVPAYDFSTGGEFMAPPVPYGHYAKDPAGELAKGVGILRGGLGSLCAKCGSLFQGCGLGGHCGRGDGACGNGSGGCLGHSHGGLGGGGGDCGFCSGLGLFNHGKNGTGLCGGQSGLTSGHVLTGHGHKKHFAPCHASTVAPTGQAAIAPSGQAACGVQGCGVSGKHSHLAGLMNKLRCHFCKGSGCGACGGRGVGDPCSGCGGLGLLAGRGCSACGGCGLGHGGTGCGLCGGNGCASCLRGLGAKAHGLLGHLTGSAMGMLHRPKMDWFVGAGGPVPLTPGYVPYIVTTRSPRDFFAFPPMNPNDP